MPRPVTISDEQILNAARAVFLERGIAATTSEIAKRAGVSEGTLFKRYGTKARLFTAATDMPDHAQEIFELIRSRGTLGTHADMEKLVRGTIHFLRDVVPLVLATASAAQELPEGSHGSKFGIQGVSMFFRFEMESGRIRPGDPEFYARVLVGAVWHLLMEETLTRSPRAEEDTQTFVTGLARLLHADLAIDGDELEEGS